MALRQSRDSFRVIWKSTSRHILCAAVAFGLGLVGPARAAEDFDKTSLALRTALHYDPSVDAPLHKLAELYRSAARTEELLGLYETHLSQYPQDAGAALVLARLYSEFKDRRAPEFWKQIVSRFPNDAALSWFNAKFLEEKHDPKSTDEMARAVSLEVSPSRRALWFAELMKAASAMNREELVLAQIQKLIAENSMTPEQRLRWARQAMGAKLRHSAEILTEGLNPEALGADGALEASMLRAELLAAKGSRGEATKILDDVLDKLAPDHWRRHEVLMLRMDLSDASGKDGLINSAQQEWNAAGGKTEAHALALADVLEAAHRHHEAFELLREAEKALPDSRPVESRLMDAWEREGLSDDALHWLADLISKQSARGDLHLRQVRWFFIASKNEEAKQAFDGLLKSLAPDQRVERGVELARWLRRRNQLLEAASVLESALTLVPDRWDLRRELAEMDFALRRKEEAAKLFDGEWTKNLAPDARLEIVQFLISKQLWPQARQLLEPWLKEQAGAFDGRLLLAKIFDKTGDDEHAIQTLEQARTLCDTMERYQAWLTASFDFAEAREHVAEWFRREAAQLEPSKPDDWNETTISRWLALVNEARTRREEKLAGELLGKTAKLAQVPAEKKLEMERLRLDLLAVDKENATAVETGLQKLIVADAIHGEDYRARLALLYHHAERDDLAQPLLEQLNFSKCTEANSLRTLVPLLQSRGLIPQALTAAERLTELEPGERSNWSQRIALLAQNGNESRLRETLRQVQAKAADWKLKPEIMELLDSHLLASYWREVQTHLIKDGDDLSAARRALDEVQRASLGSAEQLRWADWINGYLSIRLGDQPAAQGVLQKLKALDANQWIPFPDGLEISVSEGRKDLEKMVSPEQNAKLVSGGGGPLAPWSMRWGFALEDDRVLMRVLAPKDSALVFLADDRRNIHAVDRRTGKLRWTTESQAASPAPAAKTPVVLGRSGRGYSRYYNNGQQEIRTPLEMESDGTHLFFLRDRTLECLNALDGSLCWSARLLESPDDATQPNLGRRENRLAVADGKAMVWQPTPSVVSACDTRSGRLLWEARVPTRPRPPMTNGYYYDPYLKVKSGISVDAGKVFVYSDTAATIALQSGAIQWRLSTAEPVGFPIDLGTADGDSAPAPSSLPAMPVNLMSPRFGSSAGGGTLILSGYNMGYPYGGPTSGMTGRWAYGNTFSATLQNAYVAAFLRQDSLWLQTGNGGFISVMGLPRRQLQGGGTSVGFAGDLLISYDANAVRAQSQRDGDTGRVLLTFSDDADTSTSTKPFSVAIAGSRVYASDGTTFRIAEARSGSTLYEGTAPAGLAEWMKTFPAETSASQPSGYSNRGWKTQGSPNRSYQPPGIYFNDSRGGALLCKPLACVVGNDWIFPVRENAIACVQSRGDEPARAPQP